MEDNVQTIPLAAYESQGTSFRRIIKWLIMGWAISMVAMGLVLVISLSYSEEVVTETVTETVSDTQTLDRVAQADNQGNAIVGDGDISIGNSESNRENNTDSDEDADGIDGDEEEGSSSSNSE